MSTLLKSIALGVNVFINNQYDAIWQLDGKYWEIVILEYFNSGTTRDDIFIRLSL